MNKIVTILLAASLLLACNPKKAGNAESDKPNTGAEHKVHESDGIGLALNNGAKWKADSTTRTNVASLQQIVANATKQTALDYETTATLLQEGLDKMITECRMKGADHEALHHWLEPLLVKTKALKDAPGSGEAPALLNEIGKQLNLFTQYFE